MKSDPKLLEYLADFIEDLEIFAHQVPDLSTETREFKTRVLAWAGLAIDNFVGGDFVSGPTDLQN